MLSSAKILAEELSKDRVNLIKQILSSPGQFSSFWSVNRKYSLYNLALLQSQMIKRHISLGPVNSFEAWKSLGNPVGAKQQALYLRAPKDIRSTSTSEEESTPIIRFRMTPVFALAQTREPNMLFNPTPLPAVDLSRFVSDSSRFGYSGSVQTIEDWFIFIHSLVSSGDSSSTNHQYERILITLLVLIPFAGDLVKPLQQYIDEVLKYLNMGLLPSNAQVMKEAQRILRELFG